ncbi:MAG: HD domain-containing protein [Acidimicrobiia bacterium]
MSDRLDAQLRFILELDRAKQVLRQNSLADASRQENDAEHMWHLAVMALVLREHAGPEVDVAHVIEMLLVHDVVEIDAGDTFAYDDAAHADKEARERLAAERIFGLLPDDQAQLMWDLWLEFEAKETPEARFAASVDRLQPLLLNAASGGQAWKRHGVTADRVRARNAHIADGAPALWDRAQRVIDAAVARGELLQETSLTEEK